MPRLGSFISKILTVAIEKGSSLPANILYVLNNPNPDNGTGADGWGIASAVSDNYVIIGAPYEYSNTTPTDYMNAGKAYIFSLADGSLVQTLDNPNPVDTPENDFFGMSVAISTSYAIVGAWGEDGLSGKAYVYSTADWSLLYTLDNPNSYGTTVGDYFGYSVAITDTYALVGAYNEDNSSYGSVGAAYVFSMVDGSLAQTLTMPLEGYGTDYFGYSVALNNNYAIIGAPSSDVTGANAGRAYIYSTADWSLLHTLANPNAYGTQNNDRFGTSVDISLSYAIAGALQEGDASGTNQGKVYIFSTADGSLLYTLDDPNPDGGTGGDYFGSKVAISETYAISSSKYENQKPSPTYPDDYIAGKVYVFSTADGSLVQTISDPNVSGTYYEDYFGSSVSTNGTLLVALAQGETLPGNGTGRGYVITL